MISTAFVLVFIGYKFQYRSQNYTIIGSDNATCWLPSHYLNQCWPIVNWTRGNRYTTFKSKYNNFDTRKLLWRCRLQNALIVQCGKKKPCWWESHVAGDDKAWQMEMPSFWRKFHHWHLSFWQLLHPSMKILPKWQYYHFSVHDKLHARISAPMIVSWHCPGTLPQ